MPLRSCVFALELTSAHRFFCDAVRTALPKMRFTPSEIRGANVWQLVQVPFVFNVRNAAPGAEKNPHGRAATRSTCDAPA